MKAHGLFLPKTQFEKDDLGGEVSLASRGIKNETSPKSVRMLARFASPGV
jgi:hypothetical protein